MPRPRHTARLTDIVSAAVADPRDPAAALALTYARQIDTATHVPFGLTAALDQLRRAAEQADAHDDKHTRAFRKVAATLSAVTVTSDLGPKLLAALDALLLTPKARATVDKALDKITHADSPLAALRTEEDELGKRRATRRTG